MLNSINIYSLLRKRPNAMAQIKGSEDYPDLKGAVYFYQTKFGVVVVVFVSGLPQNEGKCKQHFFAFHIHEGNSCTGNETDFFADAKTHYNPQNCPHPYHAGDLPPLLGTGDIAFSAVLTDRFNVKEIVGKTVIIHSSFDDFTTQPGGNAGTKIACGVIKRLM